MKKIHRALALIMAIAVICCLPIQASAANEAAAVIDYSKTASLSLYKYDLTSAEADSVWDTDAYVSTGIYDQNVNDAMSSYAVQGVEFMFLRVADISLYNGDENGEHKAGRRSKGDNGPKMDTDEILAKEMGMSTSKLNRLMKLSEATKGVCELVDEGTLAPSIAYNIAFLSPQLQDTVVDLIGVNVKVSNENTGRLKEVARTEKLDAGKVRDVLEGRYPPPKVVEKPKPVEAVKAPAPPMAPTGIPKSLDIPAPPKPGNVVPFVPPVPERKTEPAPNTAAVKAAETQDKENSYVTKVILTGDRLRKYFPDVSMTPREIEDSVYDALEERRQRQEKLKQKAEILKSKNELVK